VCTSRRGLSVFVCSAHELHTFEICLSNDKPDQLGHDHNYSVFLVDIRY